jgi:hypothetical protein
VGYPRGKEGVNNYRVPVRHKGGKQGGRRMYLREFSPPKQLTLLINDYQGVMKIPLTRISPARQVGTVVHPIATDVIPSDGSDLVIHPQ